MGTVSKVGRALAAALALGVASSAAPAVAEDLAGAEVHLAATRMRPEVYMLRGFAGIFSEGLDQMGASLTARGIEAHVLGHMSWQSVASKIIQERERGSRNRIVLVGHSLGANAIIRIAETLGRRGIAVDQLITLAATDPRPVPANVRRATNYYFETHGWGEPLVAGPGFRGRLVNKDYSGRAEVGHFNIEKQRSVQSEILSLVAVAAR